MAILNTIKKPFVLIFKVLEGIYKGIKCFFLLFKNCFSFIKALIDLLYKLLFITFFCAMGYVAYKVWTGSGEIKNKLTQLEKSVNDIKNLTDSLQKTTDTLSSVKNKTNDTTSKLSSKFKNLF